MKANGLITTALAIVVIFTPLFSALYFQKSSKNDHSREYNSMSNQEIVNVPIADLASLSFDTLIAISNHFDYKTQPDLFIHSGAECIDLPVDILADMKFE